MSETNQDMPEMATKPLPEHEWLKKLLGQWTFTSEMWMSPDNPSQSAEGTETVVSLGGLWAFGEGKTFMPNGAPMEYKVGIGYDVSFKQYRGFWLASASSHLWKYEGELSEDGKVMTLSCVGPNMVVEGETANYRDVIEIVDENHRTLTSFGEDENGHWQQFQKTIYTRVS